jgi:hypothetical protein
MFPCQRAQHLFRPLAHASHPRQFQSNQAFEKRQGHSRHPELWLCAEPLLGAVRASRSLLCWGAEHLRRLASELRSRYSRLRLERG